MAAYSSRGTQEIKSEARSRSKAACESDSFLCQECMRKSKSHASQWSKASSIDVSRLSAMMANVNADDICTYTHITYRGIHLCMFVHKYT